MEKSRDEQDYSEQQRITRENLQRTEDCTAELTRNLSNIEENYIQMMQRQQQKPKPEQDREWISACNAIFM